jgi:hypothetical protein
MAEVCEMELYQRLRSSGWAVTLPAVVWQRAREPCERRPQLVQGVGNTQSQEKEEEE